jgi:hypothetical protein
MTPGQKAGFVVRRVVTAKNPIIGRVAGKAIESGVDKLVTKGISKAQDPEFQKKVGSAVKGIAKAGVNKLNSTPRGAAIVQKAQAFNQSAAGQSAGRAVRRLGSNALTRLNEFGKGHGQNEISQ